MNKVWRLGDLPFIINVNPRPTNSPLPDFLPFSVTYDQTTGLLRQVRDASIHKVLEKAYKSGSMLTGFMTDSGLGKKYADDFLNFIIKNVGIERLKQCKILEIGCGTGYLLSRLREYGATVLGIEPGSQRAEGEDKYGLTILNDFFPTDKLYDFAPFDLIIHHALLEHAQDVNLILRKQREILFRKGFIALSIHCCPK